MSPFRVSIVVACYEQGAFLHECLASIAAQTHPAHEVIVVDDGSRDPHTVRALDELCRAPIRLVRQPNLGVSAARNRGIALATGDWILPLDVDDKLAPDALAEYEAAVARDPAVDIWYPDVQIFGVDKLEWDAPEYTPWRLLWLNMLVSSSLVRRAVFDAGLTFNEEIRLGYEDWEFWIRACCEHGFRARALEKRVFFYRKWGHSRLQASDAQAEASRQQLRWSCRIFGDGARLDALKREHSPFFAIAARTPALAGALEAQEFKDCRVVDDCDRVLASGELSLFAERPGRVLLVSLADEPLAGALRDDRWLLEKLALEFEAERPSLLWLVTADEPGAAYSGQLAAVRRRAPGDRPRAVGLAIPLDGFLGRPEIIESRDGLVADVARYAEWLAPDRVRSMIVCGPHDAAVPRPLAEAEREPEPPPAPAPPPIAPAPAPSQVKLRVEAFGQGVSRLARGIIGPDWHDKLWQQRQLVRVRGWFEPPPPPAPPPPPPPAIVALRFRKGPVPFDVSARRRSELYQVSIDAPRFPPSADGPALLVVVPWIIYGGADRAIIDMLQGLTRLRPGLRKYVVSTVPCEQKWAEEVLPYVDGCFHVPPIAREQRHQFLARLVGRLGVTSLLIMNSVDGFDALALIRREHPHVRVVTQQHCFDPDPTSGAESGHPAYAASRVNNLIDAYANVSRQLCDDLRARYYVSPSKLHPIYLGIRTELFLDARRPRFVPGRRPIVLWLGRLADQKDPFTALAVARLWRDRHGTERLHFQLAGSGPLDEELRRRFREERLSDVMTLVGPTADPRPLYRDADCLMMTTRYEGIPVVIYEAMAAALPVITPIKNTAIAEVLAPDEAFYIDRQDDPEEYLRVLERILDDPTEARARTEKMSRKTDHFGVDRYAREMLALLFPENSATPAPPPRAFDVAQVREELLELRRFKGAIDAVPRSEGHVHPIFLDYPLAPRPRYGFESPRHPELEALIAANRAWYRELAERFANFAPQLARIPAEAEIDAPEPRWFNGWLPPLDSLVLYGMLGVHDPARYVEIGSGNSTKFARRAISDLGLRTTITSIDPRPRAEIDRLCDELIRAPLEACDLSIFARLGAGDILFFDGSHRAFMNSDVTVFFLEILPRLAPGVLVHVHDIFLPDDYPPEWSSRHYSEQYLLACYLLGGAKNFEVVFPNRYASTDLELGPVLERTLPIRRQGPSLESSMWIRLR